MSAAILSASGPQPRADDLTDSIGGWYWYDPATKSIELLVPYTALGGADDDFSGSLAVTLFSTGAVSGDGIHSSIPPQGTLPGSPTNYIDNPVFLSDMLAAAVSV